MKLTHFSFSLLFPLFELVIWVILVLAPTTLIYMGLAKSPHSEVISTEIGTFTLSPQEVRRIALESAAMNMSPVITALNTPGVFVEMLIELPISWPFTWHRPRLPLDVWRSMTLPFFCLPAWWFVGRGFDSLRGTLILNWPVALFGTLLFVVFAVLFCGFRFEVSPEDRMGGSWILWGMALWALLFSVFPLAWLRRRRISRCEGEQSVSL
jgi:hypothetical protein